MKNTDTELDQIGAYGDLLGQQYYDMVGSRRPPNGPRTLMFAVLEDGVRCYLANMQATRPRLRRLFEEAKTWIEDRKAIGPFAFETLCNTFDIDAERLRNQLRTMSGRTLPRRLIGASQRSTPRPVESRSRKARRAKGKGF
jgi:hypothetical protein